MSIYVKPEIFRAVDRSSVDIDTAMRFLRQPRPAPSLRKGGGSKRHRALQALKTVFSGLVQKGNEYHSDIEGENNRAA